MKKRLFCLIAVLILFTACVSAPALGGMSVNSVKIDSFTVLDRGQWFTDGKGVSVPENGNYLRLANDAQSVPGAQRAVAKILLKNLSARSIDEYAELETGLRLERLAGRVTLAFGLSSLGADLGTPGNVEVYLEKRSSGVGIGADRIDGQGNRVELLAFTSANLSEQTPFKLKMNVVSSGRFQLSLGESPSVIFDGGAADTGMKDGYFGFVLSDSADSEVRVESFRIRARDYANAQNPGKVEENFDEGCFNTEAWYSETSASYYDPARLAVEDGTLAMRNLFEGYFSTKQPYSNFEFCFDVPKLIREPIYAADGSVISPISGWLGISFGAASYNTNFNQSVRNSVFFLFEPNPGDSKAALKSADRVRLLLRENFSVIGPSDRYLTGAENFWSKSSAEKDGRERTSNFKVRMINGLFSVHVKYEDEEWGDALFEYDLGYTPFGTVRLLTYGSSRADAERLHYTPEQIYAGNIWFDNLSIENLDFGAEDYIQEIGFRSNAVDYGDGFDYTDGWDSNDLISASPMEGLRPVTVALLAVGVVCFAAGTAAIAFALRRKTK